MRALRRNCGILPSASFALFASFAAFLADFWACEVLFEAPHCPPVGAFHLDCCSNNKLVKQKLRFAAENRVIGLQKMPNFKEGFALQYICGNEGILYVVGE